MYEMYVTPYLPFAPPSIIPSFHLNLRRIHHTEPPNFTHASPISLIPPERTNDPRDPMLSFPLSPQVASPNGLTLFLSRACWDTVNALILTTLTTHAAYTDFPNIISLFLAVSFLIAIKLSAAPPVRNPSSSDSYNGQTEALDDDMPSTSLPTTDPATTAPPTLRSAQTDEEEPEGRRG